ncbi:hypothetical protein BBK82_18185 [Lentzea guizhouensis]|uniref:Uncharacterized protein n=1 Tax=Lentzea guizhouensis TaxID=1586287 RepID=A0A1B2HJ05_9PSEU|nr:hypothetical protein [Lentzea guizhouensis]ANZ37697.1 hypothetical protein BBK82_18185 [Lentzea guizhouensis]
MLIAFGTWPSPDVELTARSVRWNPLNDGADTLRRQEIDVRSGGRGSAARPRNVVLAFGEKEIELPLVTGEPARPDEPADAGPGRGAEPVTRRVNTLGNNRVGRDESAAGRADVLARKGTGRGESAAGRADEVGRKRVGRDESAARRGRGRGQVGGGRAGRAGGPARPAGEPTRTSAGSLPGSPDLILPGGTDSSGVVDDAPLRLPGSAEGR